MASDGQGTAILHGGINWQSNQLLPDLWSLSISTMTWTEAERVSMRALMMHSAAYDQTKSRFVISGMANDRANCNLHE